MKQNTIGKNIVYFRKKMKMTQEELSEKMHVTSQAVSKWENDLSYPDLECVGRLAQILHTSADHLIYGAAAVPEVKAAEQENIHKRILVISVQKDEDGKARIHLRIPLELILLAHSEGSLESLIGADAAAYLEKMLDIIEKGIVGPILDVRDEGTSVKIEVIDYEN